MTKNEMNTLLDLFDERLDTKFDEKLAPINNRLDSLEKGQEKMASRLDNLEAGQQKLEAGQEKMASRLDNLEVGQEKVVSRLDSLEEGQKKLELVVENQIDKAIKVIAEGHMDLIRKIDEATKIVPRVNDLEDRVDAIEFTLGKAE